MEELSTQKLEIITKKWRGAMSKSRKAEGAHGRVGPCWIRQNSTRAIPGVWQNALVKHALRQALLRQIRRNTIRAAQGSGKILLSSMLRAKRSHVKLYRFAPTHVRKASPPCTSFSEKQLMQRSASASSEVCWG